MKSGESEQKENIIGGIHKIVKQVINFFVKENHWCSMCVLFIFALISFSNY